ncbi:O-methyltransferase [Algivirga pacifica]|uniref:O-methyltransferase n=1 Tax=Algivirga pacifica TaxID=1162670 RepID=A0ABP9D0Y9_9BACT
MHVTEPSVDEYIDLNASEEDAILQELDRETHLKVALPNMISGHVQGLYLTSLTRMLRPMRILEIGTFTGYSGICLAKGLPEGGKITCLEINDELEEIIDKYFTKAGLRDKLDLRFGNAMEIIPTLEDTYDMIFIDADKRNYIHYYDLVFDKVRKGGYIIADNVLWKGKVADPTKNDKDTVAIREYNEKVKQDPRVENFILPLRDGLLIAEKK